MEGGHAGPGEPAFSYSGKTHLCPAIIVTAVSSWTLTTPCFLRKGRAPLLSSGSVCLRLPGSADNLIDLGAGGRLTPLALAFRGLSTGEAAAAADPPRPYSDAIVGAKEYCEPECRGG